MQQKIKSLIENLGTVYGKEPWYGDSIKTIDPKKVFSKPKENAHCIAELLSHIIGWREFVFQKLLGNKDFDVDQDASFNWRLIDNNENTAWKNLLDALEKNQNEITKILESKDDSFLNEPVPGRNFNMEFLVEGIIQHDIYHLGQISILKKLVQD